MFPSEAYRKLCEENAERLREEWEEPRAGDCIYYPRHEDFSLEPVGWEVGYVCAVDYSLRITVYQGLYGNTEDWHWWLKKDVIPLFRPDQLMEMLEERGALWRCGHIDPLYRDGWLEEGLISEEDKYFASKRPEIGDKERIVCYGPKPACALLKAWLSLRDSEEEVAGK